MIVSRKAREAFNIKAERQSFATSTAATRPASGCSWPGGSWRPAFASCRYLGGWDMHSGIKGGIPSQLPEFDQAFAALVTDLDRSGMLDRTLVMISSEFGRRRRSTPPRAATTGRRSSAWCWRAAASSGASSTAESDPTAREPEDDPLTVEDLAMTVYQWLGIDAEKKLMSPGQPADQIVREAARSAGN